MLLSLPFAEPKGDQQDLAGWCSLAWSSDSQKVAYVIGGTLVAVDIAAQSSDSLATDVVSFRWDGSSRITYVAESGSVMRVSPSAGEAQQLVVARDMSKFHPYTSKYNNPLSPDCRYSVFVDNGQIIIGDLESGKLVHRLQDKLRPSFCWWTDNSKLCLIHGSEKRIVETLPSGSSESHEATYLYQTDTGSFIDLTERLESLNSNGIYAPPRPSGLDRIWSSDGRWFVVSGIIKQGSQSESESEWVSKDWICCTKPWSTICIQDHIGSEFMSPRISPTGNDIIVNKTTNIDAADGDWYITSVLVGENGVTGLSTPVRILEAGIDGLSWFWSTDGKSIISFSEGRFSTHRIPDAHQKRPSSLPSD